MNTTQLQSIENWWNKRGSFNFEHFEKVLTAKEKEEVEPGSWYKDYLKERIKRVFRKR